jgi:two-component system cell cycle response regulator DivK
MTPQSSLVELVDNDADTREMYAAYLTFQGFQVVKAKTGMEGFTRACEARPDLIVTDLGLPHISGWDLVRRVKADHRTKAIPVVVLTSWTGPQLHEQAHLLGCARLLLKPCLPNALADEIRQVLHANGRSADGNGVGQRRAR